MPQFRLYPHPYLEAVHYSWLLVQGLGKQCLHVENMDFQTGVCIKIMGDILPNPQRFQINVGQDEDNIALHFNPRFDYFSDKNVILLNWKQNREWRKEQRETKFPYKPGTTVEVIIIFGGKDFKVKLPDDSEIVFPNHLGLEHINFLSVCGDFNIKKVDFE